MPIQLAVQLLCALIGAIGPISTIIQKAIEEKREHLTVDEVGQIQAHINKAVGSTVPRSVQQVVGGEA